MSQARKVEKAETKSQDGGLRFVFTRYKDEAGKWVRHGQFQAFYTSGTIASEGTYEDGKEHGPWKDFHENGKLAADGAYKSGKEHGVWNYYDPEGKVEQSTTYEDGSEVGKPARKKRKTG